MAQIVLIPACTTTIVWIPRQLQRRSFQRIKLKKTQVPNWFAKKGNEQKTIDSLVDKILSLPRIKLSNTQTSLLHGVKTAVLLSDFAQQLRRKTREVPDLYSTLFDASVLSMTLVLNQNAWAKERGSWVPFKIWMSEAAKSVYTRNGC